MEDELINEIHLLVGQIEALRIVLHDNLSSFWNTQWFSAVIGAVVALTITSARDYFSRRRKILEDWYSHIVDTRQPQHIFEMAFMTIYGGKTTKDGEITVIPEKTLSEKILIEFRKNYKYWNLPFSKLRFLFWRYQKALCKLPNVNREKLKKSSDK